MCASAVIRKMLQQDDLFANVFIVLVHSLMLLVVLNLGYTDLMFISETYFLALLLSKQLLACHVLGFRFQQDDAYCTVF